MAKSKTSLNEVLRGLPSVSDLLATPTGRAIALTAGESHAAELSRQVVDQLRQAILGGGATVDDLAREAERRLSSWWRSAEMKGVRRVINATGVVIHTNLGRSRLADAAIEAVTQAAGYCTLEYDIETGKRGSRGRRAEQLIIELTGAEDVLIVNNCAAAAFFVLTVFARGGEVVVSRGELVEIGGDFRVPDVLTQSGARLREVGTTNRTKLADYEKAVGEDTRMLLRVHPSNYRIVGFTTVTPPADLSALSKQHDLVFYEDIGSGTLREMSSIGIAGEPIVAESIKAGVDVVTFSGDKLLGGPQAGIIAGKRDLIDKLRRHPLYRALRADKVTYAALEATLEIHRRGDEFDQIPTLQMLSMTKGDVAERAARFCKELASKLGKRSELKFEMIDGDSATGGGAAPGVKLETTLIALTHKDLSALRIEQKLRFATVPVIARIVDDRVLLDLRTVSTAEEVGLIESLAAIE